MTRRRYRCRPSVSVSTSIEIDDGTEIEIEVECAVTPGEKATGPTYSCAGTPGCGPEVEILSALDESGKDWTEDINADRDWLGEVEEGAVEAASAPMDDDDGWRESRRGW